MPRRTHQGRISSCQSSLNASLHIVINTYLPKSPVDFRTHHVTYAAIEMDSSHLLKYPARANSLGCAL
eukprot:854416-Pleurochrysis_carterae.AAC.1